MRFIAAHTSIPVPKVFCAFTRHDWTYIVMERIDGDMIGSGWPHRSTESKEKIPFTGQADDSSDAEHTACKHDHRKCRRWIIIR